jgi:hypothetical protein
VKYLSLNKVRLVLYEKSMLLIMVRDLTPIVLQQRDLYTKLKFGSMSEKLMRSVQEKA